LFIHEKTIKFGRADQWYDGSFNLKIPNWASQRQQWQGTEKLHQVTRRCPKTPSDHPMEKEKPWENPSSVGGQFQNGHHWKNAFIYFFRNRFLCYFFI